MHNYCQTNLLKQDISALNNTERQDITAEGTDLTKIPHNQNRTYSTMLKLICGALVRGEQNTVMSTWLLIQKKIMGQQQKWWQMI